MCEKNKLLFECKCYNNRTIDVDDNIDSGNFDGFTLKECGGYKFIYLYIHY